MGTGVTKCHRLPVLEGAQRARLGVATSRQSDLRPLPFRIGLAAWLAHEMTEPMTALAAWLHAGKRLLDRGLPYDLVKAEAATERALAELARAVDVLRRLRASALRDATLQDVAARAQHRTDPVHKPDEAP